MTSPERIASAIDAWKGNARRLVWLSSGTWAEVLLPSSIDLAARGLIDPEIRSMAVQFATTGIDLSKLTDDDLLKFDLMRRSLIAAMVKSISEGEIDEDPAKPGKPIGYPECMVQLTLSPDDLHDLGPDANILGALADRATTAEAVTLRTRAARAAISSINNVTPPADVAEEGETTDSVIRFRPQPSE